MFGLGPDELSGRIVDCAGGPASFNAEATREGHRVVSCDPIYRFSAQEIRARIEATRETLVANAAAKRGEFVWDEIGSPQRLGDVRMAAMRRFLGDFERGVGEGRYRTDALPHLGFSEGELDLALCSHFLFTYSEQFSGDFHVAAIKEMCRVATEARIFPLMESYGRRSPHVEPVVQRLEAGGYHADVRGVPYEFQRGGNEMLVVARPAPDWRLEKQSSPTHD